ncbi:MAG: glycosyltransferase family 9 protein, partial [bacterium]
LGKEAIQPGLVNFSEIRSILVVRQHDQLGDFLLSTPVLRALRAHFPKARIGVVVRDYFADVVLNNPLVDEVLVFHEDGKKWTQQTIVDFWKQLRSGWDLAIVLNTVSHSLTTDLLAHFSQAKFILGSEHKVFPDCSRNFIYNLVAQYWPHARHQSARNLDIVRHIGVDTSDLSEFMYLEKNEIEAARKELLDLKVQPGKMAIGMHVGAGKLYNRWPVGRYGELAQLLKNNNDLQILLFWGPGEEQLADHFCKYTQFKPIKIAPVSLRKLAAYFKHCDALVCNDTGVMHLAAAVNVPLVAIFGPTDPAEWKPIGENFIALRGARNCTDAISVKLVYTALTKLLPDIIALPDKHTSSPSANAVKEVDVNAQFDISESVLKRYVKALDKFGHALRHK